jgi:uncharacterized protein YbjT (DUF2867 family)
MKTILVTGATGTVGADVVRELQKDPSVKVRVAVRDRAKANGLGPNAELVDFAWEDDAKIAAAVRGVDAVFLLTPFTDTAVAASERLVGAAKAAGVKKIVKLSAAGADAEAFELARWHRASERHVEESGLAWVVLRPNFFMTNFALFYPPDAEGAIYLPTGNGKAGWVDPRDVAEVAAKVLTKSDWDGKALELSGGEALSVADAAALIASAAGRAVKHVDVPEAAARSAMEGMQMPAWMIQGMLDLHGVIKNGWAAAVSPTVREVTGHAPRTFAAFATERAAGFAAKR